MLPHQRSQHRGVDGVEMDLKEIGCKGRGWINLAWDMDNWLTEYRNELFISLHCGVFIELLMTY